MKKLLITMVALFAVATASYGDSVTVYSAKTNSILAAPANVTSFILSNTNAATDVTVAFFDTASTVNALYTNATYNTLVLSSASVTNIYTNYFGVLNTNIYTALVTTTNTVAAATNMYPAVLVTVAPSNSIKTVNYNYNFVRGILATNSAGIGVTLNY